jgi:hypothetical protein
MQSKLPRQRVSHRRLRCMLAQLLGGRQPQDRGRLECAPLCNRLMGRLNHDQGELFYSFCLEKVVPDDSHGSVSHSRTPVVFGHLAMALSKKS